MRSKWKGLVLPINIYKLRLIAYRKMYYLNNSGRTLFHVKRNFFIFRFLRNLKFFTHNGKSSVFCYILLKHFYCKIGEFFFTKKRSRYLSKRKLKKRKKKNK